MSEAKETDTLEAVKAIIGHVVENQGRRNAEHYDEIKGLIAIVDRLTNSVERMAITVASTAYDVKWLNEKVAALELKLEREYLNGNRRRH